jgi:hypothetical protein
MLSQVFNFTQNIVVSDKLHISCVLPLDSGDEFVLAILPRFASAGIAKKRWDLDQFTRPKQLAGLTDRLVLLTEAGEFADALVCPSAISMLLDMLLPSLDYATLLRLAFHCFLDNPPD